MSRVILHDGFDVQASLLQPAIEQHLMEHWDSCFPQLQGAGADRVLVCQQRRALGYSVVFRYEAVAGTKRVSVFAKARRDRKFGAFGGIGEGSRAAVLARLEYDELTRAHAVLSVRSDGLRVVRPVAYVPRLDTVIVEQAEGEELGALVARRDARAVTALARAGAWLHAYQTEVHDSVEQPWRFSDFEPRLQRYRRALEATGLCARRLDPIFERTIHLARREDGATQIWTMLHGDFKTRHIWVQPDGIEVLDFGNVHEGHALDDLAALLVELEVSSLGRLSPPAAVLQDGAHALVKTFGRPVHRPLLSLSVAAWLLKKWSRRRRVLGSRWLFGIIPPDAAALRRVINWCYLDPWFERAINRHLAEVDA